ncbi:MAG: transposase [Pseudonocardiaceae bacterium]
MNGAAEALNLLIETTRRTGHGFRNFDNYRLRLLLAHGGISRDHQRTWIRRPRPRFVAESR